MAIRICVILPLIGLTIVEYVVCRNPGMFVYVSNTAINELFGGEVNYGYMHDVSHRPGSDVHGELLGGYMRWDFTNIAVTALAKPSTHVGMDGTVHVSGLTLKITGEYRIRLWPLSTSGTFSGTICGNGKVRMALGSDDILRVEECDCNADCGIGVHLDDNNIHIPEILQNSINDYANAIIKSKIKETVCSLVPSIDYSVHSLVVPMNKIFALNTSLKKMVNMTGSGIILGMSGAVFQRYTEQRIFGEDNPFLVPNITNIPIISNRNAEVILTNYTTSTLIYTAFKLNYFTKTVHPNSIPLDQQVYFAVSCKKMCIGRFFPKLQYKFPGKFVHVNISMTKRITSNITEHVVVFYNTLMLNFYIGNYSVVEFYMDTAVSIKPYAENNTVILKATLDSIKIDNLKRISPSVGHVPESTLLWLSDLIKKAYLSPRIRGILATGIDMDQTVLSRYEHRSNIYTYRDANVYLCGGTIHIGANIVLRPIPYKSTPTP